ncbi:hypothetical protein LTR10_000243 [Elasticomyces elasticus]|nr:hypothetical protein LTR10_000243 [Elasticomyces elasticus]KAK4980501.1 hypothetical protein LTR42_000808 [Elasticomyces elasticus]
MVAQRHAKFQSSRLDNIEDIEQYTHEGLHPVHLNDTFANGRYRVVHKLGFDGFSTVWLVRDNVKRRYVSCKILTARNSNACNELIVHEHVRKRCKHHPGYSHIAHVLDHFRIQGPNGSHTALVYELAGPSIKQLYQCSGQVEGNRRLRSDIAQRVAFQAVLAMDCLHESEIVHNDVTSSNILIRLEGTSNWSQDDIYRYYGVPITDKLVASTDTNNHESAPTYVVEPAGLSIIQDHWRDSMNIMLIDFGISFVASTQFTGGGRTPLRYCAPEIILDKERPSKYSNVWALACTMYEIRGGLSLFGDFFDTELVELAVLKNIVGVLGKLPEPWWSDLDAERRSMLGEELPEEDGEQPLRSYIQYIGSEDTDLSGPDDRLTGGILELPHARVGEEETDLLVNMLGELLRYDASARPSTDWILKHPWFREQILNTRPPNKAARKLDGGERCGLGSHTVPVSVQSDSEPGVKPFDSYGVHGAENRQVYLI